MPFNQSGSNFQPPKMDGLLHPIRDQRAGRSMWIMLCFYGPHTLWLFRIATVYMAHLWMIRRFVRWFCVLREMWFSSALRLACPLGHAHIYIILYPWSDISVRCFIQQPSFSHTQNQVRCCEWIGKLTPHAIPAAHSPTIKGSMMFPSSQPSVGDGL